MSKLKWRRAHCKCPYCGIRFYGSVRFPAVPESDGLTKRACNDCANLRLRERQLGRGRYRDIKDQQLFPFLGDSGPAG